MVRKKIYDHDPEIATHTHHRKQTSNWSHLIGKGLSVCPVWGSRRWGRRAGARVISSDSKELEVLVQFVIGSVVGVGGLEVLPVLLAEDAEIVRGHGVPAEVGHGLKVLVEGWFSKFGWWEGRYSRDGWEDFITAILACRNKIPVSTPKVKTNQPGRHARCLGLRTLIGTSAREILNARSCVTSWLR